MVKIREVGPDRIQIEFRNTAQDIPRFDFAALNGDGRGQTLRV
jgi:hypothetical protein